MHVLVVEADPMLREFLKTFLTNKGFQTRAAASPDEAAGLLRESDFPPDVALLELLLRGTTGIAYADALVARHPRIQFLFMAGGRDEEQPLMRAAHRRGIVLHKPFTPQQLLDAMPPL